MAFYAEGSIKSAWIIVLLVFTFVLGIGILLAAFYLVNVRRKIQQQVQLRRRTAQGASCACSVR